LRAKWSRVVLPSGTDMAAGPSSAASWSEVQHPGFLCSTGPVNGVSCRDCCAKKWMMNGILYEDVVTFFPWTWKPVYGLFSGCLHIAEYHRKLYIALSSCLPCFFVHRVSAISMDVVNVSNTAAVIRGNKRRVIIDPGVVVDEENVHQIDSMGGVMDDDDFGIKVAVAQHGGQQCCLAATTTMLRTLMEEQSESVGNVMKTFKDDLRALLGRWSL